MINISEFLDDLIFSCQKSLSNSLLIEYKFHSLSIKGVFIAKTKTLILNIVDTKHGWCVNVDENGCISEKIPNEVYKTISEKLKDSEGIYSNKDFFLKLKEVLQRLSKIEDVIGLSKEEIVNLLKNTKTSDKKYDNKNGDKPFYYCMKRVEPSYNSLNKIERVFGMEIKKLCLKSKITFAWFNNPKNESLIFLDPNRVIHEIKRKSQESLLAQ